MTEQAEVVNVTRADLDSALDRVRLAGEAHAPNKAAFDGTAAAFKAARRAARWIAFDLATTQAECEALMRECFDAEGMADATADEYAVRARAAWKYREHAAVAKANREKTDPLSAGKKAKEASDKAEAENTVRAAYVDEAEQVALTALNEAREARGEAPLSYREFMRLAEKERNPLVDEAIATLKAEAEGQDLILATLARMTADGRQKAIVALMAAFSPEPVAETEAEPATERETVAA